MIPPHEPTEADRQKVQRASGLGLPHSQICALVGISEPTLRKYYSIELALGKAVASSSIADTLYNKAMAGDTTAMIWWTKAQMRWSETSTMQMANADGTKLEGINVVFVDPKPRE